MDNLSAQTFSNIGEAAHTKDTHGPYVGRVIVAEPWLPALNPLRTVFSIYQLEVKNTETGKKKKIRLGKEYRSRRQEDKTLRVREIAFTKDGLEATITETMTIHPLTREVAVTQSMPDLYGQSVPHSVMYRQINEKTNHKHYSISRRDFPR